MASTGENIRRSRLLSDTHNAVVVAIDHGLYFGPLDGLMDIQKAIQNLDQADGVLMSGGMVPYCLDFFSRRGAPSLILRLNWATNYVTPLGYSHSHSVRILSALEAVHLGADIVVASLTIKTPDEHESARNVEVFCQYVIEKRQLGVPIICEVFPIGGDEAKPEDLHQEIAIGCRLAAELGADMIKTFFTGRKFEEITSATPIPILALGSTKKPRERDALMVAAEAIEKGARGVVFGRNVVQARDPERLLAALKDVVQAGMAPDTIAEKYHLD
jgi:DhnA family fructose-bisphosphate aldolase class Ia